MDSNLALMIAGGIILSIFGVISALNASIEDRSARLGQGLFILGIGMVAWSWIMAPDGLSFPCRKPVQQQKQGRMERHRLHVHQN